MWHPSSRVVVRRWKRANRDNPIERYGRKDTADASAAYSEMWVSPVRIVTPACMVSGARPGGSAASGRGKEVSAMKSTTLEFKCRLGVAPPSVESEA